MSISTLTDVEKFKFFFLQKLKEHKNIVSDLLYGNKEFIDNFQVTTIEKGLEELVKDNVIKIEYTPYARYVLNEEITKRFSTRLKLLLIASKKKEGEFNKEFVASVLAEEYHPSMTLLDALHHCLAAYQEALEHKQLELAYRGDSQTILMELLKAPSKQELFPKTTDTYSLEQYYNSFINHILQQLRLTNVGWCRKELGFD